MVPHIWNDSNPWN